MKPALHKLPEGDKLLELYQQQYEMFDRSLAIERDITVKNFAAFGAVLLAQSGFFLSSLKPHVVFAVAGISLIAISIAARAMAIIYSKYSDRLYILAAITLSVYLRGREGLKIYERREEAGRLAKELKKTEGKKRDPEKTILPDADDLSWREFRTYRGALALINLIPALIGLVMILIAICLGIRDSDRLAFAKPEPVKNEFVFH